MHEFSLASNILERALAIAHEHGDKPIRRVTLEIGALQEVAVEALLFAFDASKTDTLAQNAQLEWMEIPARVECEHCGRLYEPEGPIWVCPACQGHGGTALQGDEFLIASLELED